MSNMSRHKTGYATLDIICHFIKEIATCTIRMTAALYKIMVISANIRRQEREQIPKIHTAVEKLLRGGVNDN